MISILGVPVGMLLRRFTESEVKNGLVNLRWLKYGMLIAAGVVALFNFWTLLAIPFLVAAVRWHWVAWFGAFVLYSSVEAQTFLFVYGLASGSIDF